MQDQIPFHHAEERPQIKRNPFQCYPTLPILKLRQMFQKQLQYFTQCL